MHEIRSKLIQEATKETEIKYHYGYGDHWAN